MPKHPYTALRLRSFEQSLLPARNGRGSYVAGQADAAGNSRGRKLVAGMTDAGRKRMKEFAVHSRLYRFNPINCSDISQINRGLLIK
jgi:hypothetical protein